MTLVFRAILIIVSILFLLIMLRKIHNSKVSIDNAIFWIVFSFIIVLMAIFPQVPIYFADLLGIQSPVNLVYLVMIFVLIVKLFKDTLQISKLEEKIKNLAQEEAIMKHDNERENSDED